MIFGFSPLGEPVLGELEVPSFQPTTVTLHVVADPATATMHIVATPSSATLHVVATPDDVVFRRITPL
jgi:hypothetical protein